jgi:phage-related minor tail protein
MGLSSREQSAARAIIDKYFSDSGSKERELRSSIFSMLSAHDRRKYNNILDVYKHEPEKVIKAIEKINPEDARALRKSNTIANYIMEYIKQDVAGTKTKETAINAMAAMGLGSKRRAVIERRNREHEEEQKEREQQRIKLMKERSALERERMIEEAMHDKEQRLRTKEYLNGLRDIATDSLRIAEMQKELHDDGADEAMNHPLAKFMLQILAEAICKLATGDKTPLTTTYDSTLQCNAPINADTTGSNQLPNKD